MPVADLRELALDEVDSTNTVAARLAAEGERGPLWVRARVQTQGRGRSGRAWTSVDGNLYASLLTTLDCTPAEVPQLALVAGVAVAEAITAVAHESGTRIDTLRLKWPNDVLIGGAKVAGILAESAPVAAVATSGVVVIIGIGINLAAFPPALERPVTALAVHGVQTTPAIMLRHLAAAMDAGLARWRATNGFETTRNAWLRLAGPVGQPMSVNIGAMNDVHSRIDGTFAGLAADGSLLLQTAPGEVRAFTYGDVTLGADKDRPR